LPFVKIFSKPTGFTPIFKAFLSGKRPVPSKSRYIWGMRLSLLALSGLVLLLVRCGSGDTEKSKRFNDPNDSTLAAKTATEYYEAILAEDGVKMKGFFADKIDSLVPSLLRTIHWRKKNWGEMKSYHITENNTWFTPAPSGDTTFFAVTFAAVYEYNQSMDVLHIQKIGDGPLELVYQGFYNAWIIDCSNQKLEEIKPIFQELSEHLVLHHDDQLNTWFEPGTDFRKGVLAHRDEYFPSELVNDPTIAYYDGYFRQYCGSNSESNGFMTYEVILNDTLTRYITFVAKKETDSEIFDLYQITWSDDDGYNRDEDVQMAQQLSKEILRMVEREDYKAFFHALHEEAQLKNAGLSETDWQEMMKDYHHRGKFKDFWSTVTVSQVLENEDFIRYVVIAELETKEGNPDYIEITFKPDKTGKLRLMGFGFM
jgi:hypothetical protein